MSLVLLFLLPFLALVYKQGLDKRRLFQQQQAARRLRLHQELTQLPRRAA